jgi:TolB-like protein/Flp pilus assembly protein TadD
MKNQTHHMASSADMDDEQDNPGADSASRERSRHSSPFLGFWQELRERRAFRVGATYVFVVWALMQAADVLFPILGFSDRILAGIFLVALIGFPVVLLMAWVIQWGPDGPRFDSPLSGADFHSHLALYLLTTLLLTGLLSALIYQSYTQITEKPHAENVAEPIAQPAPAPIPNNSIAVLRFANLGGNEADEFFSDGLSEELLNLLARLQELKVASRTSSWAVPEGTAVDAIRDRLRVAYVLEGSVRRSGDVVRVTAQLIDSSDGYHVWSEIFDRRIENVFSVQDQVARKITNALEILLSEKSRRYLRDHRIENDEAYEAYLQGAQQLRMPADPEVLSDAEQFFTRARDLEPRFAQAWAGLCKTRLAEFQFSKSTEDFEGAESACHRTLTLDDSSPGIFEALGDLYAASGQYDKATEAYESALVLAPQSADAMMGLGRSRERTGDSKKAREYLELAIEADPGHWKTHNALGSFYFNQGHYEEAIPHFRRVTALEPYYAIGHNNLGAAYMLSGQYDKAVQEFSSSLALRPDRNIYSNIGSAHFLMRNFDEAAAMYQRAVELAPDYYRLWGHLADALAFGATRQAESQAAYEKALELAREQREINPSDPHLIVTTARYYARLGETEEAKKLIGQLDGLALDVYVYYDLTLAFIAMEDESAALDALRSAVEEGYGVSLIAQDPSFDMLRENEAFLNLIEPAQSTQQ